MLNEEKSKNEILEMRLVHANRDKLFKEGLIEQLKYELEETKK